MRLDSNTEKKSSNNTNLNIIELLFLLYISTSVWVLRTPNAGRNSYFQNRLTNRIEDHLKINNSNLFNISMM